MVTPRLPGASLLTGARDHTAACHSRQRYRYSAPLSEYKQVGIGSVAIPEDSVPSNAEADGRTGHWRELQRWHLRGSGRSALPEPPAGNYGRLPEPVKRGDGRGRALPWMRTGSACAFPADVGALWPWLRPFKRLTLEPPRLRVLPVALRARVPVSFPRGGSAGSARLTSQGLSGGGHAG